jgi:6-phosphogluconolactonase
VSSPNGKNLYVLNHDSNTVVVFAINTDGSLAQQQSCTTPGTLPTQLAINKAGTYLYVVETYQPGFNANNPGPGALVVFPVNANGQLGATGSLCTPVANGSNGFFPVGNNPVGGQRAGQQQLMFMRSTKMTPLSPVSGGLQRGLTAIGTFPVGVAPNAIASDPTSRFLYVTDGAANQMIGFLIQTERNLDQHADPLQDGHSSRLGPGRSQRDLCVRGKL